MGNRGGFHHQHQRRTSRPRRPRQPHRLPARFPAATTHHHQRKAATAQQLFRARQRLPHSRPHQQGAAPPEIRALRPRRVHPRRPLATPYHRLTRCPQHRRRSPTRPPCRYPTPRQPASRQQAVQRPQSRRHHRREPSPQRDRVRVAFLQCDSEFLQGGHSHNLARTDTEAREERIERIKRMCTCTCTSTCTWKKAVHVHVH